MPSRTVVVSESVRQTLGYRFLVRCTDPVLERIAAMLLSDFAPVVRDEASGRHVAAVYSLQTGRQPRQQRHFELLRDDARLAANFDPARVVDQLVRDVSREALAYPQSNLLLVHAGVVATPRGGAVVLTGESGSGKTTIVAALVQEGYSYLSDEAAVIDPDTLLVRPWARPLAFKPSADAVKRFRGLLGSTAGPNRHVPVSRIRENAVGVPCAAHVIIDYAYDPTRPTAVQSLSPSEAVALLGSAAPALRERGDAGLQLLARLVSSASGYRLRAGSLDEAVRWVRTLAEDFN